MSVIGFVTGEANSTTLNLSINAVKDETIICVISYRYATPTWPTGWTLVESAELPVALDGTRQWVAVLWRRVSTSGSITFTYQAAVSGLSYCILTRVSRCIGVAYHSGHAVVIANESQHTYTAPRPAYSEILWFLSNIYATGSSIVWSSDTLPLAAHTIRQSVFVDADPLVGNRVFGSSTFPDFAIIDYVEIQYGSGGGTVIEPLNVSENGTYTAPAGVDGYSPITVDVETPPSPLDYHENSFLQGIAVGRAMKGVSYAEKRINIESAVGRATAAYYLYSIRNIAVGITSHIAEIPAVRGVASAVAVITGRTEKATTISSTVSPENVTGIASVRYFVEGRQEVSAAATSTVEPVQTRQSVSVAWEIEVGQTVSASTIGTAEAVQTQQSVSVAWEIEGRQYKNVNVSGMAIPVNGTGAAGVTWEYVEV